MWILAYRAERNAACFFIESNTTRAAIIKLHQVVDVELSDSKLINGIGGERAASRPPRR